MTLEEDELKIATELTEELFSIGDELNDYFQCSFSKGSKGIMYLKWIKCSEKMPPMCEQVLIFIDDRNHDFKIIAEGSLDESRGFGEPEWSSFEDWFNLDDVTHWMPFPEPPKD